MDGKEAGGVVCPGTNPHSRPGIPKHDRTKKTVIAREGSCGLFLPYRELLNHLKDKAPSYYYTDVLVPSGKTLKDFIE